MTSNATLTGNDQTQQAAVTALGSDVNLISASIDEAKRIIFNSKLDDGVALSYRTRPRVESYLMKLETTKKRQGLAKENVDALTLALATNRIRRGGSNPSA